MVAHRQSPHTVRIVSGLLAIVWLCAGFVAIVVGVNMSRWLLVVIGVVALWYGLLWVRVVRQGRQLTIREALTPWRVGRRSDA
jgi:hypothetical protein